MEDADAASELLSAPGQGKLNGMIRDYYSSGSIRRERFFKNGILDGTSKTYFPSGAIQAVVGFKQNRLHGLTLNYYESGAIQAEDYDVGANGVTYYDATGGNTGGAYRNDDVDIEGGVGANGHNVGWIDAGEWLEFTVNVTTSANYEVRYAVASEGAGPFRIELSVDGTRVEPGRAWRLEATRRYRHRLSASGEPIYYTAMVATKLKEIPDSILVEEKR